MKTALIPVDPLDDLAALQDKIAWAKSPRALLLWPQQGCAVQRTLDFVRLRRAADALGTQIALITRARGPRREAEAAGIPVFPDRKTALRKAWRWRRVRLPKRRRHADLYTLQAWAHRPQPWSRLPPLQRWGVFTAGVMAVLLLAAFILPGARLTLTPIHTSRTLTLIALVSPTYAMPSPPNHLPARWETVTVGDSAMQAVSGISRLPQTPAHVALTFTNLTAQAVDIPAGTRIHSRTGDIVFTTTESAQVPPGPGTTAEVSAASIARGRAANRPAHDLGFLEGPLAFQVTADNPLPAAGGRDTSVPAPAPDDYRHLEATLRAQLATQALAVLERKFPHAWIVLPSLQPAADLERTFDPPQRAPANTLRLTLRVRFRALVVDPRDAEALARSVLAAQTPHGMTLAPSSIQVKTGEITPQGNDRYAWHLRVRGTFIAPLDQGTARRLARGRSPNTAAQRLQQALPLAAPPEVSLWPSWWPWVTWLPFRIQVRTTATP